MIIQARRTHTPPYQSSQQSQILVIGWDSTHKNEHLFNVSMITMLHEGNNYTTCKLKQKGVNYFFFGGYHIYLVSSSMMYIEWESSLGKNELPQVLQIENGSFVNGQVEKSVFDSIKNLVMRSQLHHLKKMTQCLLH